MSLAIFSALAITGCGGSNNTPTNVGLFGNWNVVMYPTNSQTPVYVFGLAMSKLGSSNYSGGSAVYTGSVPKPSNMCINAMTIQAAATTSGNNYNMTFTDTSGNTIISVTGTLNNNTQTTTVTGNYTNSASLTCPASQGSMNMVAQ